MVFALSGTSGLDGVDYMHFAGTDQGHCCCSLRLSVQTSGSCGGHGDETLLWLRTSVPPAAVPERLNAVRRIVIRNYVLGYVLGYFDM